MVLAIYVRNTKNVIIPFRSAHINLIAWKFNRQPSRHWIFTFGVAQRTFSSHFSLSLMKSRCLSLNAPFHGMQLSKALLLKQSKMELKRATKSAVTLAPSLIFFMSIMLKRHAATE